MNIIDEINRLKKEKNAVVLVHNYQPDEVQDAADFLGDSLELARAAKKTDADIIVLCGVMFMAETAKILNPEKKVLIPVENAGCPLADFVTPDLVRAAKKEHPDAKVVLYVNSTAESKALADITCTSSNAVDIVKSLDCDEVLLGPDSNLASWVRENVPDKKIIALPPDGCCPVHSKTPVQFAESAKKAGFTTVCHPECPKAVRDACDWTASTGQMISIADKSDKWAVLTEKGMAYRLKCRFPQKEFMAFDEMECADMKLVTPELLLAALKEEKYEVKLPSEIIKNAGRAIEAMLRVK